MSEQKPQKGIVSNDSPIQRRIPKFIKHETATIRRVRKAAIVSYLDSVYESVSVIQDSLAIDDETMHTILESIVEQASAFYARMIKIEGRTETQEDNNLFDECVTEFMEKHAGD